MAIPKVLHFIWVGNQAIAGYGVDNINAWLEQNPDIEIKLWVDREGTPASVLERYSQEAYFQKAIESGRFSLMDITEHGMVTEEARYEIDRLRPNYGAASDLLRYRILHKYGGAYYDCDIEPADKRLDLLTKIWQEDNKGFFRVVSPALLACNNDCFFVEPHSPLALAISQKTHAAYRLSWNHQGGREPVSLRDGEFPHLHTALFFNYQTYCGEDVDYIFKSTLERTGPEALDIHIDDDDCDYIAEAEVRQPLVDHALSWVGRGVKPFPLADMEQALACVIKEIDFELAHIGTLRLDAHIQNLLNALVCPPERVDEVIEKLLMKVGGLDLSQVRTAQCTFKYPQAFAFLRDQHLLHTTYLFPHLAFETEPKQEAYLRDIASVMAVAHQPYADSQQIDKRPEHIARGAEASSEIEAEHQAIRNRSRWNFLAGLATYYHHEMHMELNHHLFSPFTKKHMHEIDHCLQLLEQEVLSDPDFSQQDNFQACQTNLKNLRLFIDDWLMYDATKHYRLPWRKHSMPHFPEAINYPATLTDSDRDGETENNREKHVC